MPDRPHLFLEFTISLCPKCMKRVDAKVIELDGKIYMDKWCPDHGRSRVLINGDAAYHHLVRRTNKPGQMPLKFGTRVHYGCPFDCGLCDDHEQHSCLSIIEITDACNLRCPVCYANSGPHRAGQHRTLQQVEFMMDQVVRGEGEPDVVQISGGEPTIHPQFFQILDAARQRPIKHLMLNTNGLTIATQDGMAERLAEYMPGFELYLQWDSLREEPIRRLRGANLLDTRYKALEKLNALNLSTTLVMTVSQGLNDDEIGPMIDFALKQKCVRGVTFQPIQHAGRTENFNPATDRLTLGDVRRKILEQTSVFGEKDVIPVPCHPDCIAMAYALKVGDKVQPLTGLVDPQLLMQTEGSTIVYEKHEPLRRELFKLFSTSASPESSAFNLKQLLCCLPLAPAPLDIGYDSLFRVIIMRFMDAYDMDVRSVKKSCVHIVHPDGRIIPFDTYNLLYRDGRVPPTGEPVRMTVRGKAVSGV